MAALAALFLSSDDASFVTGVNLSVERGASQRRRRRRPRSSGTGHGRLTGRDGGSATPIDGASADPPPFTRAG
jgi:hypothetical protein